MEPVTFTLEPRLPSDPPEFILTYDFNKFCDTEAITGCNLLAPGRAGSINATEARAFLYAFLRTSHDVSLAEAGSLMSRDPDTVLKAVLTLIKQIQKQEQVVEPDEETQGIHEAA